MIYIAIIIIALLAALIMATPRDSLDEQAKAIRENQEAKEERKRMRKNRRRRWQQTK